MRVIWRLIRSELKRYRTSIVLRVLMAAAIAATPYAFSFLGKWLVDEALQVSGPPKPVAAAAAPAATSKSAVDRGLTIEWRAKTTEEKLKLLAIFVAVSLCIHVFTTLLGAGSELLNSRMVQKLIFDLRTRVHDRLANADMETFSKEPTGQLMTRVLDDCGNLPPNLVNLVINVCTQIMMLILGLVLLLRLSPSMTWVPLAVLPLYAVICYFFLPRLRQNTEDLRQNGAHMNGYLVERLGNILTIKNYAQEPAENKRFGNMVDRQSSMAQRQHRLNLGFNTLTTLITSSATLAVLAFGFLQIKNGDMKLGEVLAFFQVTAQLFVPISALIGMATVIQTLQVLARRIYGVLDAPCALEVAGEAAVIDTIRGDVEFDAVSLKYFPGGPFAVEDLSFSLPAGATVCLVGPTGCGKSTVINLLTRFHDTDAGTVRIDGIDVRRWPLRRLRRSIGNILKDCDVFSGTLAENIAYGAPDADADRIAEVARLAGLQTLVADLPKGLQTRLGKGGEELDAESLLRLNLARALITNPAILTVDDSFVAVGEDVEVPLRQILEQAMAERTILIATSRLSICTDADLILVLNRGRLEQMGTHDQLMAAPGLYRRMYTRQMGLAEALGSDGSH